MFKSLPALQSIMSERYDTFKKDERGSLLIFSLFVFVTMLLVAGLAVDFMRVETQRVRLQSTLDRAVLAGASLEQTLDSEDVVRDYFARAGLSDYLDDVQVYEGEFSKTVLASASAHMDPYFMQMLGMGQIQTNASGIAREGFADLEISLILDVSGSMSWSSTTGGTKIEELKDAAQEFVYRVQCNPDTENLFVDPCTIDTNSVSINLVMYNEQVLVGETLLNMYNITNEHNFSSCVDFDHASYFDTGITGSQALQRAGHIDAYTSWYKGYSGWEDSYQAREFRRTCRVDPNNEIMPLEEDWQTLYNRIENLNALGGTSIEMGMKWGTALLDPDFLPMTTQLVSRHNAGLGAPSVIPEFSNRPMAFNNPGVEKFVVLMTDGENTWHYQLKPEFLSGMSDFYVGSPSGAADPAESFPGSGEVISVYRDSHGKYKNPFTGTQTNSPQGVNPQQLSYVELWERYGTDFFDNRNNNTQAHNWLSNPVNETNGAQKNADLVAICAAAKDQDVQIYTVGFETSVDSTAKMKKCASSHSHHFDVDGGNIDAAFAAIARSIQKLRLIN